MKVIKHKRINREKDELYSKIKLLCPDARICRTRLSIYVRAEKQWKSKQWFFELPKIEIPKIPESIMINDFAKFGVYLTNCHFKFGTT